MKNSSEKELTKIQMLYVYVKSDKWGSLIFAFVVTIKLK